MKKEVIPKKVNYEYASGKETISENLGKAIPKQFIPTKRVGTIFGIIILAVIILAAIQFPFGSLMSGNTEVTVDIGYPWTFLQFELSGETAAKPIGLTLDILLYLLLAYAIDVIINLIIKNPLLKSENQLKQKPAVFKDQKISIAEKVTQKVLKEPTKK